MRWLLLIIVSLSLLGCCPKRVVVKKEALIPKITTGERLLIKGRYDIIEVRVLAISPNQKCVKLKYASDVMRWESIKDLKIVDVLNK